MLTVEELPPGSRLCVGLSAQLLLQVKVQLSGVKGHSALSKFGTVTGPTCLETHKRKEEICRGKIYADSVRLYKSKL